VNPPIARKKATKTMCSIGQIKTEKEKNKKQKGINEVTINGQREEKKSPLRDGTLVSNILSLSIFS
jgi:hypothetical protein